MLDNGLVNVVGRFCLQQKYMPLFLTGDWKNSEYGPEFAMYDACETALGEEEMTKFIAGLRTQLSRKEIKKILSEILVNFSVKKAILFGSYAKNLQTKNSDIDLVIDSQGTLLNIYFYGLLEEIVERTQKKVDLFEISEIKSGTPLYKAIEEEGIVVYEK